MSLSKDLDDILDAALDELDDDDIDRHDIAHSNVTNTAIPLQELAQGQTSSTTDLSSPKPAVFGPPRPFASDLYKEIEENEKRQQPPSSNHQESVAEVEKAVAEMMKQMENLFPGQDFAKEGNTHVNITPEKVRDKEDLITNDNDMENNTRQDSETMNDAFTKLLRGLSSDENLNQDMFQNFGDQMTEEMQREWEETIKKGSGEDNVMDHVVDGMMKQLLSREFMYEPMKDITDKFPKWLADNKAKLSVEDYER